MTVADADAAITEGLMRSAQVDVLEAADHLRTICRTVVPSSQLRFVDEALAQLAQADARITMALGDL